MAEIASMDHVEMGAEINVCSVPNVAGLVVFLVAMGVMLVLLKKDWRVKRRLYLVNFCLSVYSFYLFTTSFLWGFLKREVFGVLEEIPFSSAPSLRLSTLENSMGACAEGVIVGMLGVSALVICAMAVAVWVKANRLGTATSAGQVLLLRCFAGLLLLIGAVEMGHAVQGVWWFVLPQG